ncbi:LD-carboxypeptidase [Vulcanococcus sp. Clear-D1]|uniref:S66 peptidase family protein n=1 Tax=Vulcanococcus sp. Clear-D1 TaxID=2766970 RepID=UPI001991A54C|nr:LD-carboxypeptidase [Vulcanococcus sp. Clear-D1]MBD1193664.1 LD-carboxypeptidase [Vulcanococcus sp. Clear-D1]
MRRRRLLQAGLAVAGSAFGAAGGAQFTAPQPPALTRGSRIAALAPGTWLDPADPLLDQLSQRCAAEGWELLRPPGLHQRWHWFAGTDAHRHAALQQAWLDPRVDALFYVGAGWGSARVLEAGWRCPASPRWCLGFSDCSALLLAQWAAGSVGGVHGWFGRDAAGWQRLVALLQHRPVAPLQGFPVQGGVARGPLVVSNLTIATSLIGTPWLPPLKGAILVLEDTGEAPYRIDRQLTQWRSSGLLDGVAGIGLGRFSWAEDDVLTGDFSMEEILLERLAPLGVPLVRNLPVGHGRPNLALPLGPQAELDGRSGQLRLLSA